MLQPPGKLFAAATAGVVVGASLVLAAGALRGRTEEFDVTARPFSSPGAISVTSDGWTYSIPTDVAWRDRSGSFHDSGRPDCLPPSGAQEGPVRIKARLVDADGVQFRQVFYVDCT